MKCFLEKQLLKFCKIDEYLDTKNCSSKNAYLVNEY